MACHDVSRSEGAAFFFLAAACVCMVGCSSSRSGDPSVAVGGPGNPGFIVGPDALHTDSIDPDTGPVDAVASPDVPAVEVECVPCVTTSDCGSGECVSLDAGRVCLSACPDSGCPEGFGCLHTAETSVCAPISGACPCSESAVDESRPCAVDGTLGACEGTAGCNPAVGWTCSAQWPSHEVCDHVDNDCDGEVDEDFKVGAVYFGEESCGECGVSCGEIDHGHTACSLSTTPPECLVTECDPGYVSTDSLTCELGEALSCVPCELPEDCPGGVCAEVGAGLYCLPTCEGGCAPGYTCQVGDSEPDLCVPTGGSCECTPETLGLTVSCESANEHGACPGMSVCTEEGFGPCDAPAAMPEDCNGLDDDCDGVADEELPDDLTCTSAIPGVGTCVGLLACEGADGWVCNAKDPEPEVCDYQDNDCDGDVDDSFRDPVTGLYTADVACGACGNDCGLLAAPHAAFHCAVSGAVPDCALVCEPSWVDTNELEDDGCECHFLSADDPPDGVDQNCDGIDGDPANAVFVSVAGSDLAPGTADAPVRTVDKGIQRALENGKGHVYVTGGEFEGGALLGAGVQVFCGFDLAFSARSVEDHASVLLPMPSMPGRPGTVTGVFAAPPVAATGLDGCTVVGADATEPGQPSYAVYLRNASKSVALRDNAIHAGTGAAGEPGVAGEHGQDGTNGLSGEPAFDVGMGMCVPGHWQAGGAGGTGSCGGVEVSGGKGGQSICADYDESAGASQCPASDYQNPKPAESGSAGLPVGQGGPPGAAGTDALQTILYDGKTCGYDLANCGYCHVTLEGTDGGNGAAGKQGAHGGPGAASPKPLGDAPSGLWAPMKGMTGGDGTFGTGGGGGGAAGGVEVHGCVDVVGGSDVGGSGGGGGSGACGGKGGTGGQGGAASFGIFATWTVPDVSLPTITGNTVTTAKGGAGGKGGDGGVGGVGGFGGQGGTDGAGNMSAWCAGEGGTGGHGGTGGSGGGGGGGAGGPSIGILVHAPAFAKDGVAALETANTFQLVGGGGAGGPGGASKGKPGVPGLAGPLKATLLLPK